MQELTLRCSQILELLYDLNECPETSPEFRYDLDLSDKSDQASDESAMAYDVPTARAALTEARQELRNGELTPVEYKRLEESIIRSRSFAPARSYLSLLSTPHEQLPASESGIPSDAESYGGYVSTRLEEQYKQDLDNFIAGASASRRPSSYSNLVNPNDRSTERDRDTALRNPVSVYNWLRKHQPQVFLQDKENDGEKTTKVSNNSRGSKRGSLQIKSEAEMYDDEGIALEPKTTSRGKRKRDADGGYRPKGGSSSKPTKRKREEGGSSRRTSRKIETPG